MFAPPPEAAPQPANRRLSLKQRRHAPRHDDGADDDEEADSHGQAHDEATLCALGFVAIHLDLPCDGRAYTVSAQRPLSPAHDVPRRIHDSSLQSELETDMDRKALFDAVRP